MNVDDFKKEYEKIKKGQQKKEENKSTNVEAFLDKYNQIKQENAKAEQKAEKKADIKTSGFKTLEEAQKYAKQNNLNVIDKQAETVKNKPTTTEKKETNLVDDQELKKSYIQSLSERDQTDYLQDFYDMYGEFGGNLKSRYLKNFTRDDLYEGGADKALGNYVKALKEQKETQSISTKLKTKVINPIGSLVLGAGEGVGGGAIAKKTMEATNQAIAHLEAIKNGGDAQTYYDTMNTLNELPSSREVLDNLYDKAGNHTTLKGIGETAGYIGAGALLTAAGVPAPLAYATVGNANAYGKTDDTGDILFETGKSAAFGFISSKINSATGKLISEKIPITKPIVSATTNGLGRAQHLIANVFRNFVSSGVAGYGANAITEETRNLYNYARGREVTKEDIIRPVWSKDALRTTIISGAFGAVFGTANDMKKAEAQLDKNINTLHSALQKYNNDIQDALKAGNAQAAYNLNEEALQVINDFNSLLYLGRNMSPESQQALANYWNNVQYDNINKFYKPNFLGTAQAQQNASGALVRTDTFTPSTPSTDTSVPPVQPPAAPTNINTAPTETKPQESQAQKPAETPKEVEKPVEIKGLEDYTEDDIKNIAIDHIEEVTEGNVKIKDIDIKDGKVTLTYDSDLPVDTMDKALNTDPLKINDVEVNITPVKFEKKPKSSIVGLEDYSVDDIKNEVKNYINEEMELSGGDFKIKGIEINGSRARGDAKKGSDLDVVVEYEGSMREDDAFNGLNEKPLKINGIKVDINPIRADKSGTLEEYMKASKKYDQEKLADKLKVSDKALKEIDKTENKQMTIEELPKQQPSKQNEINKAAAKETKTVTKESPKKSVEKKTVSGKIDDFGEKIGGARKDIATTPIRRTKQVIPNYTVQSKTVTDENGKEIENYSVNFKGRTLQDGFKSEKEAEEFIKKFKDHIKQNSASVKEVTLRKRDGTTRQAYEVYVLDPKTLKKRDIGKYFDTKEEAESFALALSMYISEHGKNLFRPQIQRVERNNPSSKNSTKATGQQILDTYKFRAGEFGNWVNNEERQRFLNYGYDALNDLAEAMEISPADISYGNMMAIAFGARGHGLTGAIAHFEPLKKVINMTKLKGAGTVAHEMGHALDNYLSRLTGYSEDGMLSKDRMYKNLPEPVKDAFQHLLDVIQYSISTDQEDIDKKNKIYEKNRIENLNYHLNYYDKLFDGKATKYKRVKGKYEVVPIEVTPDQKKEYQRIRQKLVDGKLDSKREYNLANTGRSLKSEVTYGDDIEKLKSMIKETTGRKADEDNIYWVYKYGQPSQQVKEVKSESAYHKSSVELDKMMGRAKPYYSTIEEMLARSFESFIYDELEKKGIVSQYLVHSVQNGDYALYSPYPEGEERNIMDAAWRKLIDTMKQERIFHDTSNLSAEDDDLPFDEEMPYTMTSKDSQGKELSEAQLEYFKDSKIRDSQDHLLVMYHNTPNKFTVFDKGLIGTGLGTSFGNGFYFGSEPITEYGRNTGKYYINVVNPYVIGDINKTENVKNFLYMLGVDGDTADEWLRFYRNDGKSAIGKIIRENNIDIEKELKEYGYDGIVINNTSVGILEKHVLETEVVAFDPNQIKSVSNENPTDNPDTLKDEQASYSINEGFYSQAEKVIATKMANKADAQTIKNLLNKNGAKQDELDWLDMDTFLSSKDSFTKQEVLDYIKANQLQLEEVVRDDNTVRTAYDEKARLEEDKRRIEVQASIILEKYGIDDSPLRIFHLSSTGMFDHDIDSWMNSYLSEEALGEGYPELENDRKEFKRLYEGWEEDNEQINMLPLDDDEYYHHDFEDSAKFKRFTTDLTDDEDRNYREVLFTLPNFEGKPFYKREHWDDTKNVIAHTRLQDYTDDEGKSVLFVEEVQSDLHQKGRKEGYQTPNDEKRNETIKSLEKLQYKRQELVYRLVRFIDNYDTDFYKKRNNIAEKLDNQIQELEEKEEKIKDSIGTSNYNYFIDKYYPIITRLHTDGLGTKNIGKDDDRIDYKTIQELIDIETQISELSDTLIDVDGYYEVSKYIDNRKKTDPQYQKTHEEYEKVVQQEKELYETLKKIDSKIDPRFPFKKTWHEFVIRKIINEAVQNGYDKVAWTTGKQQNERYNLSNYIDSINYIKERNRQGVITAYDIELIKDGSMIMNKVVDSEKDLEELIGKSATEKIVNSETDNGKLEGLDLEVGGEGMKGFYDKIIPEYVSKYIKKWGGKLEDVVIGGNHQQGFTITPEMKKAVETEGQALFEPRAGYNTSQVKGAPTILSTSKGKSNKPMVVGSRIWKGFQQTGYTNVSGIEVHDEQDIAEVSQIYRNPNFETFRIVYTKGGRTRKDGKIVGTEAVSSKIPGKTAISTEKDLAKTFEKIRDRMKRLGADGYYMVHNHPTGVAKASKEDVGVTKLFRDRLEGLKGHVIVNNGTYAFIDTDLNVDNERQVDSSNALYHGSQFQTALKSNKTPWNNQTITSRDDLAALMYNLKNDDNYSSLILRGARGAVNAIIDIPNKFFNMSKEQVEGYIRNVSKQYGATEAFIGTTSQEAFDKIKNLENVMDSILYQNGIVEGEKKLNGVFNNAKSTPTRVAESEAPYTVSDGFYSQVEKAIATKMPNKADPQTIKNILAKNGAKQDELYWLDMDAFLASKSSFTKQEVLDYIKANQLKLEEITYDSWEQERAKADRDRIEREKDEIIRKAYNIFSTYGKDSYSDIQDFFQEIYDDNFQNDYPKDTIEELFNSYLPYLPEEVSDFKFTNDIEKVTSLYEDWRDLEEELGTIPDYTYYPPEDTAKFKRWSSNFGGGGNYREVLFTLPDFEGDPFYANAHWDDIKNVLAHTRLQDYQDEDGNSVLFVEEIQSDLHQEGRKNGYKDGKKINELQKKYNEAEKIYNEKWHKTEKQQKELSKIEKQREKLVEEQLYSFRDRFNNKYHEWDMFGGLWHELEGLLSYNEEKDLQKIVEHLKKRYEKIPNETIKNNEEQVAKEFFNYKKRLVEISSELEELRRRENEIRQAPEFLDYLEAEKAKIDADNILAYNLQYGIDSRFPFKKTWHEFVIRKIINEAVQNGYKKVAWTTGTQQNERYGLSNYLTELTYFVDENGKYDLTGVDGETDETVVIDRGIDANKLEEYVGKEIAQKIISGEFDEGKRPTSKNENKARGTLEDVDLEVGSKGMEGFYDKIIPDYVSKYIKKWGGKLEDVVINGNHQPGFRITPEMRKAVTNEGQVLFEPQAGYSVSEDTAPYSDESDERKARRLSVVKNVMEQLGISAKGNVKKLAEISDAIVQRIEDGSFDEDQIDKYAERLGDEIMQTDDSYYNENKELKETIRRQKLYVSDAVKNGFADWNDFRKRNIGTLRLTSDKDALPVDSFYNELNEIYGDVMFPLDIVNASDQLVRISETAKSIRKITKSFKDYITETQGRKAWDEVSKGLAERLRNYRDNYDLIKTPPDEPTKKVRKLADSMQRSDYIPDNLKQRIMDNPASKYDTKSNKETLESAKKILETNENARDEFLQNELRSSEDSVIAILLMNKAIQEGNLDEFDRISVAFLEKSTNAGQIVQALSMLNRLTPEGMLLYGKRQLESAIRKIEKENPKLYKELKKSGKLPKLSREKEKDIIDRMKKIEKMPDGRQKNVEIAKVLTDIANEIPPTTLEKVASLRITGLLLNLKTLNRNLGSNISFSTLEMIKDIPATAIDYLTSLVTGVRTTKLPSLTTAFRGFKTGWSEAVEDLVEGIDTGNGSKFTLPKKTFKRLYTYHQIYDDMKNGMGKEAMKKAFSRMLSDLEDTAGFFVNGTDRPFWRARLETELKNQMELAGLVYGEDMPTAEMEQLAVDVANYATFKNKNMVSDVLRGIKNAANLNKPIGAGDLILGLTFPGVPGGVASKISDYTFGGAVKVVKEIYNAATKNGEFDQRKFADMLGRVITGLGAIGLGILLYRKHILFGGYDDDKDIADMQKASGVLDNSINVSALKRWFKGQSTEWRSGDQMYTFDYMQPISALPIIGIDMYDAYEGDKNYANALWEGFGTVISQVSEMSAISQLRNLFRYGDLPDNLLNSTMSSATSFIPTLSNNAAQYFDETSRRTKDNTSIVNTFKNIIKNKLPFARNTLEPKVDTLGNDIKQYRDGNSFLATFIDPGERSTYEPNDVQNALMNVYNATGRRDIFPRVAPTSISVNGELEKMTPSQQTEYQRVSGRYANTALSGLVKQDTFKNADNDTKAIVMNHIADDANSVARAALGSETNEYRKLQKKLDVLESHNVSIDKYYEAYLAQFGAEGEKNVKEKTIPLSKDKEQKRRIDEALADDLSERQLEAIYEVFDINERIW